MPSAGAWRDALRGPTGTPTGQPIAPRGRRPWVVAGLAIFGIYLTAITVLRLYPHAAFDWDSSERALDAILLRDFLVALSQGRHRGSLDVAAFVRAFQDTYTAGGGLITWPPLQVALLIPWVSILGATPVAFALFNVVLAAILFLAVWRLSRELFPETAPGLALLLVFAYPPTWLSIPNLTLRIGEAAAETLVALSAVRYARYGQRHDLLRAGAAFSLGVLYAEQTAVTLPVVAALPWLARRRHGAAPASRPPWALHVALLAAPFAALVALSLAARLVGLPDYFEGILYRKGIYLESVRPVAWNAITTGLDGFFRLATTGLPAEPTFGPLWQRALFILGSLLYFWKAFALGAGAVWFSRKGASEPVAAERTRGLPPAWGWPAALAVAHLLFLARAGALPSYLLPPWVLLAVLAGGTIGRALRRLRGPWCPAFGLGVAGLVLWDAGHAAIAFHAGRYGNGPLFDAAPAVAAIRDDLAGGGRAQVFVHMGAVKAVGLALHPRNADGRVRLRWSGQDPLPALRPALLAGTDAVYLLAYGRPVWGAPDAGVVRAALARAGVTAAEIPLPPARCQTCQPLTLLKLQGAARGPGGER